MGLCVEIYRKSVGSCFSFVNSSQKETIWWLLNGCLHAFNIFERIQPRRETIIIISNETMPVVWRALEQGSPRPKPTRIKSGNDTEDKDTSLSLLAC